MSDPLAVWVGSCRDTRSGEGSSPRSWSEFWTCCITLGKSLPCFCLHPHSKFCPSAARPCHSLCCGGAQGQGLHGGRASVSESRVVGTWMWGLDVQWHHQLLGSGRRGCAGALLLGTGGARLCSCPSEGCSPQPGVGVCPGEEGRAEHLLGPTNPLIPFPSSPDPTDSQAWVQPRAQQTGLSEENHQAGLMHDFYWL